VRRAAAASPRLRARLCLHPSVDERLHNMLIVLRRGTRIPVHRHLEKAECYHVISGLMSLILCSESGGELRRVPLGAPDSGRSFVCRIAAGMWHTVEVESEEVILHESTIGPYQPADTEYRPSPPA
jgi:cupin fold WbuC family metalloprotein